MPLDESPLASSTAAHVDDNDSLAANGLRIPALSTSVPHTQLHSSPSPVEPGTSSSFSFAQLEGKSPSQQLEALQHRLLLEVAIKEGAENLLSMDMAEGLRAKVQSELGMAKTKIEAITQRIEQHSNPSLLPSNVSRFTVLSDTSTLVPQASSSQLYAPGPGHSPSPSSPSQLPPSVPPKQRRQGFSGPSSSSSTHNQNQNKPLPLPHSSASGSKNDDSLSGGGEDFRTSLQQATNCIKTLSSLNRSFSYSPSPTPTPNTISSISPTGASASSPPPPSSSAISTATLVPSDKPPSPELTTRPLVASSPAEADKQRIDTLKQLVGVLSRNLRVRYELNFQELLLAVSPALSDTSSKQCRALAYRAIRHALIPSDSVQGLCSTIQWYIVRSLARDSKHAIEKEQAIKLIRAIVEASKIIAPPSHTNSSSSSTSAHPINAHGVPHHHHVNSSGSPANPTPSLWNVSTSGAVVASESSASGNDNNSGSFDIPSPNGGPPISIDDDPYQSQRLSPTSTKSRRARSHSHSHSAPAVVSPPAQKGQFQFNHPHIQQRQGYRHPDNLGLGGVGGGGGGGVGRGQGCDKEVRQVVMLTQPVMRALVAVAEHADDPFRMICLQTLAEILLIDIKLLSETGGLRLLLHALGEGSVEMSSILAQAFLHIVDSPKTRVYLRVGYDLEIALSAVTDAYGRAPDHADRMVACIRVIQTMLKTWSGLMYFCMHDMRAIKSLVEVLRIPSLETREIVLDMFFSLFNIKSPDWFKTFISGRRLTIYRHARSTSEAASVNGVNGNANGSNDEESGLNGSAIPNAGPNSINGSIFGGGGIGGAPMSEETQTIKLTDQYIGLLIMVFTSAGIIDALTCMLQESTTGSNLSRKATLLMAELLHITNRVLPLSIAAKIQAIPHIFDLASDYSDGEHRIVGTLAFSAIDSFNRHRARGQRPVSTTLSSKSMRPRANSVEDSVRRGQRQVEQVKIKMGMQMDDKAFQSALLDTQVMITKEYSKWNFEVLQDLIEGPLLNPKRMEEAIKVSRFVRRIMQFYWPFLGKFSRMPNTKANSKWVKLGCTLLTTLLSSQEGLRYLQTEDKLLPQIVRSFAQLDPFNGHPDSDPVFSKKRIAETLTYGYFEMLGTLSAHKEGVELMEKFKIFTAFYHLSELRSREDLIKGIIENLDYSIDGHPRIILSKALTSSYKHIRTYATRHLGDLIRNSSSANAWTLRLLLTQLYDPAPEVCEQAVQYLEDACESQDILQLVVEMQPTMEHLGEIGQPLLMKFMSTPTGFRYLYDTGYIDREMDIWFHERNIWYVVQVEVFLSRAFDSNRNEDDDILVFDGTVPPHFYGQMAKTDFGCQILADKGHFTEFVHFIRQHNLECDDAELIMKLKSILWAVGNVGATEGGLPFLEENDVIPAILEIADKSPIPSVRGTCFFVLGLISSTSLGAEILDDFHWEATLSPLGLPTGLCVPVDVERFVSIPPWEPPIVTEDLHRLELPTEQTEVEVMTAIQNLSNTVIANAASRSLAKMRSRSEYRHVFTSPTMFFRALHTISTQRYRLPVRRYILDLFSVELNSNTVNMMNAAEKALLIRTKTNGGSDEQESSADANRALSIIVGGISTMDSDEEVEEDDDFAMDGVGPTAASRMRQRKSMAVEKLRPMSKIIGFAA